MYNMSLYATYQLPKANAYENRHIIGYLYISSSHNTNKVTLLCKQPVLSTEMVTTICAGKCWLLLANGYTKDNFLFKKHVYFLIYSAVQYYIGGQNINKWPGVSQMSEF